MYGGSRNLFPTQKCSFDPSKKVEKSTDTRWKICGRKSEDRDTCTFKWSENSRKPKCFEIVIGVLTKRSVDKFDPLDTLQYSGKETCELIAYVSNIINAIISFKAIDIEIKMLLTIKFQPRSVAYLNIILDFLINQFSSANNQKFSKKKIIWKIVQTVVLILYLYSGATAVEKNIYCPQKSSERERISSLSQQIIC